jgi:hypothetical protein
MRVQVWFAFFLAAMAVIACAPLAQSALAPGASLELKAEISAGAYRLQTVRARYTAADINHLLIKLYKVTGGNETAALNGGGQPIQSDVPQASLGGKAVFTNLDFDTTYRVRAYAYATAGTGSLISTNDSRSYLDVAVGRDDRPVFAALPVQLIDVVFSGEATASGVVVTDGSLVPSATASVSLGAVGELQMTTSAGSAGNAALQDGTGGNARFNVPIGMTFDRAGNMYVADNGNFAIRKITPAGLVTTLVGGVSGYADGNAAAARFTANPGIVALPSGTLFVSDVNNNAIRMVSPSGDVLTIAGAYPVSTEGSTDGNGQSARLNGPYGVAADAAGNLYVTEYRGNTLRKITQNNDVSTVAGGFNGPRGVAIAPDGTLYVADMANHCIKKIVGGSVSVLAGSCGSTGNLAGFGSAARFFQPFSLAVDLNGSILVADRGNCAIRKVTPAGYVTTVAGRPGSCATTDGAGQAGRLRDPLGIAVAADGAVYVSEGTSGHTIRKIVRTSLPVLGPFTDKYPSGTSVAQLPVKHCCAQVAATGNYVHLTGGNASGVEGATVYRAARNADGTLGAFSALGGVSLTAATLEGSAEVVGNALYVIGGRDGATVHRKIDRATLNADGSISGNFGAVAASLQLTSQRFGLTTEIVGPFVYAFGGGSNTNSGFLATVERAPIAQDGTLGAWVQLAASANLQTARWRHHSAKIGSYIYIFGGDGSTGTLTTVERASFDPATGELGAFVTQPAVTLATGVSSARIAVVGGYVYLLGGLVAGGSYTTAIQRARINADSSLGTFEVVAATLPSAAMSQGSVLTAGYLHVFGGWDGSSPISSAWSAPIEAP